jgi:hypothetical protein
LFQIAIGQLSVDFEEMLEASFAALKEVSKTCIQLNKVLFENGQIEVDVSEANSFVYSFNCNDGYNLRGQAIISCKEGIWDNDLPACREQALMWLRHFLGVLSFVVLAVVVVLCRMIYKQSRENK